MFANMPEIVERGCISRSDKSLVPYWQIICASVNMQPDVRHVGHGELSGSRMRQNSGTGKEKSENGKENFGPTDQSGPPTDVVPNIPVRPSRNEPFYLTPERGFRKFCLK